MKKTINGFVACRLGSTRVKFKNLLLLEGRPLFTYLTDNVLKSKKIDNLYLNTDSHHIINVAKEIYKDNLNYYLRPSNLGNSATKLDDYVFEFMNNVPSDITIFFNPCCLFLKASTVDKALEYFINNDLDSLCASRVAQTLCFLDNKPVNFLMNISQPRTQDLSPVHCQTCAFFIWKSKTFIESYKKNSAGNFCGKFESYGLSGLESIDIDTDEDLKIAESILKGFKNKFEYNYHKEVNNLIKKGLIKPN